MLFTIHHLLLLLLFSWMFVVALRGAATLKVSAGYKNKLINGVSPVLPIEDLNFDFENCRSIIAKGAELNVETPDGKKKKKSSISNNYSFP